MHTVPGKNLERGSGFSQIWSKLVILRHIDKKVQDRDPALILVVH